MKLQSIVTLTLLVGIAVSGSSFAQHVSSAQNPIVLSAQGSIYVGGEKVKSEYTYGQNKFFGIGPGSIQRNQMYVEYQIPQMLRNGGAPIILVHGGGLSGAAWDTTPDGREGWKTYFLRLGYPVYTVDWAMRGRSSFDPASINQAIRDKDVKGVSGYPTWTYEVAWPLFRLGPKLGEAFAGTQFPIESFEGAMMGALPILESGADRPVTTSDLVALLDKVGPATIILHSASGAIGLSAALTQMGKVRAVIAIEPSQGCATATGQVATDEEVKALASKPFLAMWGDNITPTAFMAGPLQACNILVEKLRAAGGKAENIRLPENGHKGNSHLVMMDKNSHAIADMIAEWLDPKIR